MKIELVPFRIEHTKEPAAIEKLMEWRNRVLHTFVNQKPATIQSTHEWLLYSLQRPDLQLYWVKPIGLFETPIGHIGLIVHDNKYEVGYVLRGESRAPGAMGVALDTLVNLDKYQKYFLRVKSDNTHAIKFYERHGFVEYKRETEYIFMER